MTASVRNAEDRHRFELTVDEELAGVLVYRRHGSVVDLAHTEVYPGHEGQGLGAVLVRAALDDARTAGLRVLPSCSYVASYLAKHPEYGDLVG